MPIEILNWSRCAGSGHVRAVVEVAGRARTVSIDQAEIDQPLELSDDARLRAALVAAVRGLVKSLGFATRAELDAAMPGRVFDV
jgi:hypothetical protein